MPVFSITASPGPGESGKTAALAVEGGGGGRQVPQKDGESFALISLAAFCSVYLQKKKKKVSCNLVG